MTLLNTFRRWEKYLVVVIGLWLILAIPVSYVDHKIGAVFAPNFREERIYNRAIYRGEGQTWN